MQIRLMTDAPARRKFRARLLAWYDAHGRELPWRGERDPYRIWVSEIMLQQTRVNAVREYYARFLARFPTVEELARASEDQVLANWSGLGYYRRARALQAAAREIRRIGQFPGTSADLRKLPGIGRYTAAAIASIAFGEPAPVVDGNVTRVLSRIAGHHDIDPWILAEQLLSRTRPGDFNQAMMDLGATLCTPRAPQCRQCPVVEYCATRAQLPSGPAAARKRRTVACGVQVSGERILLSLRPKNLSLMPAMWELPKLNSTRGLKPRLAVRHSITDTDYAVKVFILPPGMRPKPPHARWVDIGGVQELPLTGLARKILKLLSII